MHLSVQMILWQYYFEEDMYVLYDAREAGSFKPYDFKRKDILPHIGSLLESKSHLVFSALDYLNTCYGYVCFYYDSCDSSNYGRIPQIVNLLSSGIGNYINQKYQTYLNERIEHMYTHDALTGLNNRMGFAAKCDGLIKRAREKNSVITMVLADLDGLKYINDNFGHAGGDNAIYIVAQALKYGCPKDALCVRFGGDELIAVVEGRCSTTEIRRGINQYLEDYNVTKKVQYIVSSSVGIIQVKASEDISFDSLLKEADALMYEEKINKKIKR